ncbi:hypothetical protein ACG7TL_008833 [Trametes sanguinea]
MASATPASTSEPRRYEAVIAHVYEVLGHPYKYGAPIVGMRSSPKMAFGFVLGPTERRRWAVWYGKYMDPDNFEKNLSELSPEEMEKELQANDVVVISYLPGLMYAEFPQLPRLRQRLLPVRVGERGKEYLFVLRDDGTARGMVAHTDPVLMKQVAKRLGVPDQEARWYKVL